jgi:DNA-binding MarR family transcriptional regulator
MKQRSASESLQLSSQVCFPVYLLAREVIGHYRPLLEALDLTYPQYLVLLVLWETNRQTVNQLGEQLKLDSGTLTPLLKRLEHKGLLNRARSNTDERVVELTLTAKGKALKQKARCIPEQLMSTLNVSAADLLQLKQLIEKIRGQLVPQ